MPTYRVKIPGQGSFRVESDHELTDEQAYDYALGGAAEQPTAEQPTADEPPPRQPGTFEQTFGQTAEDPNFVQDFAGRTGRRVGAAADAFLDLPESLANIVTGGQHGRLDALLRTVQGVASPVSAILAPVEAAGEQAVSGLTGSEQWGRLAGDVTGMAGTLGLGMLAKAGKLGSTGQQLATVLGVGRPKTLEEAFKRDPHLKFIAEAEPPIGASHLEEKARGPAEMAELAMDLNRPEMARVALGQSQKYNKDWQEYAKLNNIISDIPDDPQLKVGNIIFDDPPHKDINFVQTLGTLGTRAAAINPELGGPIAYKQQLTELNMGRAIENRHARNERALTGLSGEESRRAIITRSVMNHEDIMAAGEDKVPQSVKNLVQFLHDKFEVDRQIALPRARDLIRDKIAKTVKNELGDATEAEQVAEVQKRVMKAIPENAGIDEAVLNMFPGNYRIVDKKGTVLKTAHNGIDWKMKVQDLVESGWDPKDLDVQVQAYMDSELLQRYKGRVKRTLNHITTGLTPTKQEIEAAARGEYFTQKAWSMMGLMKGESGSAKGYTDDLLSMLNVHDRSLERWLQVTELKNQVAPMLKELKKTHPTLAGDLKNNMSYLWGHRMPGSARVDNLISATPILRDITAPMLLERWSQAGKTGIVNMMLKFNPRFQAVNATQLAATLWPIADADEIAQGFKMWNDKFGTELLQRHGASGAGTKVEGWTKGLGPAEKMNQEVAFLTMYNRARKYGYSDGQAADYGKLRGQVYSQFMGLTTDQPQFFRKMDPTGMMLMFQRFPVKQMELMIDLIKDRNFPGVAKWMAVNLALGGFKAATMGQAGWLTYKLYKDIEKEYGKGTADVFHAGLPALLGADISGSVQLMNPPFGGSLLEQIANFAGGPMIGLGTSMLSAAMDKQAVDTSTKHRVWKAFADRNPLLKGLTQLFEDDVYDFKDTSGRLRWRADAEENLMGWLNPDLLKTFLGFKPLGGTMGVLEGKQQMKPGTLDTFLDAFMEMEQRRGNVLDYAASRYGAAQMAGIDLGKDLQDAVEKEVAAWNELWPEFPITGDDIMTRAQRRAKAAKQTTAQRVTGTGPKAIRQSPTFQPLQEPQSFVPPPPGELPFEFFGGG